MVALLVILTVLVFLTADYFIQRRHAESAAVPAVAAAPIVDVHTRPALAAPRSPAGVFFAPGHTWTHLRPSGTALVGLTDFARSLLGQVDEVEPRAIADEVHKGDVLLRLRHGRHSATFHAPFDGSIERVNLGFLGPDAARPDEPYTSSWIYEIRPRDTSDIPRSMFLGEAARSWLKQEVERLKVFLATLAPEVRAVGATMQDGGLPSPVFLDALSDQDWTKLQDRFFGRSTMSAGIALAEHTPSQHHS